MRVGFLHDDPGYVGGAEMTMAEFAAAAPPEVEVVDTPAADTIVIGNCVGFGPSLIGDLNGKRVAWYHNDLSPHINPELKGWLDERAEHIFCSPMQRDRYGLRGEGHTIPPALDLDRFKGGNGSRAGAVSIGAWQNPGKGQQSLWEWAKENGELDVYGDGPFAPTQPPLDYKGSLEPDDVPAVLQRYATFVYLPWDVEPFGRCVVEAWAAGCELVVNRKVGARYWLEWEPDGLRTAAEDFWRVVTA